MVRTRFAPSPTGYLHIGGARTALYSWLYAKHHQGKFILRIEDTDLERSTPESVEAILSAMQWLELNYDEGPFYQTQRFDRYRDVANQLLAEGKAYRCYCSRERLEQLRDQQMQAKQKPRYDGHCRNLTTHDENAPFVIRFKNPEQGEVVVDDQVRGRVVFQNQELDDLIIVRTDGTPTYNFTVVVDDWDMGVTHVIRGDDHLNNTPRQMNILQALGAQLPIYAHIPMILGSDGKRLSKRHGAVSVMQYHEEGFLPEALLNYLVRLGWAHGDQEIFSMDEMAQLFDIKNVSRSPAAFNPEKLLWLNQHYMKTSDPGYIAHRLTWHMQNLGINTAEGPSLTDVVVAQRERTKTLKEMAERSRFFYEDIITPEALKTVDGSLGPAFQQLYYAFEKLEPWSDDAINDLIRDIAERFNLKMGQIAQPLRIALTGGTVSPAIQLTARLLGKTKTLQRIKKLLDSFY